jgi:uncharacterized protein (DUF2141 family)
MTHSSRRTRPVRLAWWWLTLVAATLAAAAAAAEVRKAAPLSVRLQLRNDNGQVGCLLFNRPQGFPKDPGAALRRAWCPIASSVSVCAFERVPAGTYAVACFHDENKNGKLDTGLFGIPTEGTAASNNAKGFMGPPAFDKAKFSFSGSPAELRLVMSY